MNDNPEICPQLNLSQPVQNITDVLETKTEQKTVTKTKGKEHASKTQIDLAQEPLRELTRQQHQPGFVVETSISIQPQTIKQNSISEKN